MMGWYKGVRGKRGGERGRGGEREREGREGERGRRRRKGRTGVGGGVRTGDEGVVYTRGRLQNVTQVSQSVNLLLYI